MSYIIIETFGGPEYAIIVTGPNGDNLVFKNRYDAETEAKECQNGIIVELKS